MFVYFNQQSANPEIIPLLTTGQGIFETVQYSENTLWFWERHEKRLRNSLDFFNARLVELDLKKFIFDKIKRHSQFNSFKIKLSFIFPFDQKERLLSEDSLIIQIEPLPDSENDTNRIKLKAVPSPYLHPNALRLHKTINYGFSLYHKQQAMSEGYDNIVYYDHQGNILEAATANFFAIKNNVIYTPPVSLGFLPGIVRGLIIEHFDVKEENIHFKELAEYDCFFTTGSVQELKEAVQIDSLKPQASSRFREILVKWDKIKQMYKDGLLR